MPKCTGCQFDKQTSRAVPGQRTCIVEERAGILLAEKLQPGQLIFIDHFQCSTRGPKFKGQGIQNEQRNAKLTDSSKLFKGGCIFVDAATGYIDVDTLMSNFKVSSQLVQPLTLLTILKQTQKIMGLS